MTAPAATPTTRIATDVGHALTLLQAAERQFRLHNTDTAIQLLIAAETRVTSANNTLQQVTTTQRFAAQRHVNTATERIEAFRHRMAQL